MSKEQLNIKIIIGMDCQNSLFRSRVRHEEVGLNTRKKKTVAAQKLEKKTYGLDSGPRASKTMLE